MPDIAYLKVHLQILLIFLHFQRKMCATDRFENWPLVVFKLFISILQIFLGDSVFPWRYRKKAQTKSPTSESPKNRARPSPSLAQVAILTNCIRKKEKQFNPFPHFAVQNSVALHGFISLLAKILKKPSKKSVKPSN